jgi:hypothetical protein
MLDTLGATQTLIGLVVNDGTKATSSTVNQGSNLVETFTAAASLQTFIDFGGTNADFIAGTFSSLTEIVDLGTITGNTVNASQTNTFSFAGGNNILIGDSATNTFIMAPSIAASGNIIYGGGGTSTYELYGSVVILYTHDVPTPQEIESLNLGNLTVPGAMSNITYLIDPGPNDVRIRKGKAWPGVTRRIAHTCHLGVLSMPTTTMRTAC